MADLQWTQSQRESIGMIDRSVLVSAGAGSGKTAVLAERCAHLVADATPPCPVDALLVVTFTDAAAAEMRQRIEAALRRRLADRPSNRWLQEQIALIDTASICTIHSFCRRVLNRYFAQADLDPQTPVLDPQDAALLRIETAQNVLDRLCDRDDSLGEAVLDLLAAYGSASEERFLETVLDIHGFLASVPDPDAWLADSLERSDVRDGKVPAFWIDRFTDGLRGELEEQTRALEGFVLPLRDESFSFTPDFAKCLGDYRDQINVWRAKLVKNTAETAVPQQISATDLDAVCQAIAAYKFGDIPRRNKKIDESTMPAFERSKLHAVTCRDTLLRGRLQKSYGTFRLAAAVDAIARTLPHLRAFLALVRGVMKEYQTAKRELGAVDFSDMERMTLDLLRDESNGVAGRLRNKYRFVLVDEFQDVNPLQEEILRRVSREDDVSRLANLFAVGDVKQSIYRFRLAEPRLFIQRRDSFPALSAPSPGGRGVTIDLLENFRSRPGVINAVNAVFDRLMAADLGNIDYDERARLKAARSEDRGSLATRESHAPSGAPVELHLLESPSRRSEDEGDAAGESDAMDWEQIEREAYVIAQRIRRLVAEGAAYRDIVILLRSMQARAGLFVRTLLRQGVPVFADTAGGIFESLEVMDVVALLRLLDNQRQDIPLAALLRSPVMGPPLTDDEMADIRVASRPIDFSMPFHDAARWYARNGPRADLRDRLAAVLERLGVWRQRARRRPLADVLWEIYDESGYLAYVAGLRDGPQRRANLLRLHEYARQFGAFNRQGLYRFLRFVEALRDTDQDLEPGSVASASQDVVRVMTIHRSKGLEFPIVFIGELGKRFNFADAQGGILYDRKLGLALEAVDLERRIRYSTLPHRLVAQAVRSESLAEELRIFYVALTRARERLILVGTGDIERLSEARSTFAGLTGPLPLLARQSATCVQDWMIDALACQPNDTIETSKRQNVETPGESTLFSVTAYSTDDMKGWALDKPDPPAAAAILASFAALKPAPVQTVDEPDPSVIEIVRRRLTTAYPAHALTRVPSVVAASVLKRRWDASQEPEEPAKAWSGRQVGAARGDAALHAYRFSEPSFLIASAPPDAPQRGTWTHEFLQRVDLARPCDLVDLHDQMAAVISSAKLDNEAAMHIDLEAVAWFFASDLGRRLRSAKRVLREWPFVLGVDPTRFDPMAVFPIGHSPLAEPNATIQAPSAPQDLMLVRGMIDCLFDAGEGWEILDYKTDAVTGDQIAARRDEYRGQLSVYGAAVEAAWKAPPGKRWLVFLSPREVVQVGDREDASGAP